MLRKNDFLSDNVLSNIFTRMAAVASDKNIKLHETMNANDDMRSVYDAKMGMFKLSLSDKTAQFTPVPLAPPSPKHTLDMLALFKGTSQMTQGTVKPMHTLVRDFQTNTSETMNTPASDDATPGITLNSRRGNILPFIRPAGAA